MTKAEAVSNLAKQVMLLNAQPDVCIWLEITGHVNWVQVSMAENKEKYNVKLFSRSVSYNSLTEEEFVEAINTLQHDLEDVLANKDDAVVKAKEERRLELQKELAALG